MSDPKVEKQKPVPPFVQFCCAAIPQVFDDSLSYYEALCAMWKYLDETVKVINNNALVTEDFIAQVNELHDYIEHYFDNLDVQEEINNKLDEMALNGTLSNIINNELFNNINNQLLTNTADITELQSDQALNVKKGENSSVSMDMLTQEVRESLTGGSTAVVGRDSVNSENIADGAVSIIKLDDKLKDNFDINLTAIELADAEAGYYYVDGDTVGGDLKEVSSSDNRKKYVYNLEAGKTYRYTGYNAGSARGMIIGTAPDEPVIAFSPDMGKLNKDFYTSMSDSIKGTDILFTVSGTGLKAFISVYNDTTLAGGRYPNLLGEMGGLFVVTSITPYDRTISRPSWKSLTPTKTISEVYIQQVGADETETQAKNPYHYASIADRPDFNLNIYPIYKNHTYKAVGQQKSTNAGLMIFDNKCILSYCSLTVQTATTDNYTYEFTPTFNGFAVIQNGNRLEAATLYESAVGDSIDYRMTSKVIAYNGDSITESRLNEAATSYNAGAYPKLISDITDSTYYNYAHGGATLAYSTGDYHHICREIDTMNGVYDAIIFSGGINDYWHNIPLGDFVEGDYTGDIDDTTVCGGLESIFRQAINKWYGKPIMFVITHKCQNTPTRVNSAGYTFDQCYEKIKAICNKYAIPYYDAYHESGLNGGIEIMSTTFMTAGSSGHPDGTHPNESAYLKYYVPQVIKLIERNLPYPA